MIWYNMFWTTTDKRKELLYEAFKPAKSLNEDGGVVNGPPLIAPPVFIQLLKTLITNYGNVEGFNIMSKTLLLIDESQIVATDLYGEGLWLVNSIIQAHFVYLFVCLVKWLNK